MPEIIVDLDKCIGCGKCRDVCVKLVYEPVKLEEFGNKIKYLPIHEDKCLLCRTCVGICPTSAIIIRKKKFKKS